MENVSEKLIGYTLLIIGIIMLIYPVFNVYQVFTKQATPINLFEFKAIGFDLSKYVESAPPGSMQQDIVPPEVLNSPLNYVAHLMLMGFMGSIGYKIAMIATMLVRPIKVNLKETPISSSNK